MTITLQDRQQRELDKRRKEIFNATSYYAYYVPNPFKELKPRYDKNGVLCFISMEQYLEEVAKPKNRFTQTTFEALAPKVCIAASFLLICAIIGLR